ncbi:hypothetical protein AAE02nite_19000 [Adhaeribacter aerolatus]|uniref:TM2 domain-containing protein n=1 Tax=Adhaeribacter aerolatus TaxID=670289 RepID=A0A512AWY8_9BACT|nr:TM2 domain-containing protein [Adhaeribacter aerolatus]GEO04236.1 hypothetical protein AAE02nite_19000 [Adhaeribacter aerolatus]
MKTKISTLFVAVTLLLSSCAKESFYFTNTGTSYGSKKVKSETPAAVADEQVAATDLVTATETEVTAPENLTASTEKTAAINTKDFTKAKPLYQAKVTAPVKAEKVSKVAQAKAAIKVNKQVKAIVKEAKKNDIAGTAAEGKSQMIAAILAFVVGVLGVHRFYLGYTGIGIAQLLTLGGCGIWSLIDLVRIIIGDLKPKGGDYAEKF